MTFVPFVIFFSLRLIYLNDRVSERGKERQREGWRRFPSAGSLLRKPPWSELDGSEDRSQKRLLGLSHALLAH